MLADIMLVNLLIATILCRAVNGSPKESVLIILKKASLSNSFGSFYQTKLKGENEGNFIEVIRAETMIACCLACSMKKGCWDVKYYKTERNCKLFYKFKAPEQEHPAASDSSAYKAISAENEKVIQGEASKKPVQQITQPQATTITIKPPTTATAGQAKTTKPTTISPATNPRCNGLHFYYRGCCTGKTPCGKNEGDCDYDGQCAGDLKCGTDNCPMERKFTKSSDCCYDPNPETKASCPISHRYAYLNGMFCCEHDKEGVNLAGGQRCDGSVISLTSSCCLDGARTRCPVAPCTDYKQDLKPLTS